MHTDVRTKVISRNQACAGLRQRMPLINACCGNISARSYNLNFKAIVPQGSNQGNAV